MENLMAYSCLNVVFILSLLILSDFRVNGQINTPCSSSMISSFTPCFSYLTGSSGTGSSPTAECCDSLKNLMSDSMDCTCLIVTGNVPVSIPFISRPLAISLPRMCKSSVPLQCKATGVALPPSGPALFTPTEAPVSHAPRAHSPKASKAAAAAVAPSPAETPLDIIPAAPPEVSLAPTENPGIRPVLNPDSASNPPIVSSSSLLLMLVGIMVLKLF
ncbi:protein YLS3-like [Olea europaea var. sylvestris]|uniref:protein YLS3-like n=1 Tax=Olea europaea var. sylvestris TaxID=158386 RepID=UPI000C1D3380|nr:protein YLS3-like [Olea europaea var. sylvestris]